MIAAACRSSLWVGEPDLVSFAAIAGDPPPEVSAAGHDRCIIPIKPEHVDAWLNPDPANVAAHYGILADRDIDGGLKVKVGVLSRIKANEHV